MAKSKKGAVALQTEVNTDEEWQELLARPGLVLVDVYCGWSGPCSAMVSTLRKIKMEIGGDTISYAIARNDDINDLERFRGGSEPVWMFLQNGKMVKLMFGANAPQFQRALIAEILRVQEASPPAFSLPANQRCPEEETKWKEEETLRNMLANKKKAEEDARKKEEYETFMTEMMFQLCEMMAVILYPWVFKDEQGHPKIKMQCPPYTELVRDLLRQIFDVQEELRIQLDEEMIKKMFVESDIQITKERIIGLTDGKCMALRMRCRPPPADWPVPYPNTCPDGNQKCPVRSIDDVENFFHYLMDNQSHRKTIVGELQETPRLSVTGTYMQRYQYIHEPDPEIKGDVFRVDPAIWAPYQARSKVHVFTTLFPQYMAENHSYEPPKPIPPLCAFKYKAKRFEEVRNAFENHLDAVQYFGVFPIDEPTLVKKIANSPEEFQKKVTKPTTEVFVVVIRKIDEEAFLAFAGIGPYYATEEEEEAEQIIATYFPGEIAGQSESKLDYFDEEEQAEHLYEADIYY